MATQSNPTCPHCGSDRRKKHGTTGAKVPRFMCKDCGKTYADDPLPRGRPQDGTRDLYMCQVRVQGAGEFAHECKRRSYVILCWAPSEVAAEARCRKRLGEMFPSDAGKCETVIHATRVTPVLDGEHCVVVVKEDDGDD